jgi:uncharacterized protein HemX
VNPYLIIAALLACLGAGIGGYRLGIDHEKANQLDQRELLAAVADEAANTAAKAIAQLKPKYTTIQNEVQRDVQTHTIYRDCKLSADGLRLANQALASGGAVAPGDSKLPGTHTSE